VLATVAVISAHALGGRRPPPALAARVEGVLERFPPGLHAGGYGAALEAVVADLEREVH